MLSKIFSYSQTLHGIPICTENIAAIEAYRIELEMFEFMTYARRFVRATCKLQPARPIEEVTP